MAANASRWPEALGLDVWPSFYIDKIENGDEDDKERAADKCVQQYSNNWCMKYLKKYEDGKALTVLAAYQKERKAKGLNDRSLSNLLCALGHPEYKPTKEHEMIFFDTAGKHCFEDTKTREEIERSLVAAGGLAVPSA